MKISTEKLSQLFEIEDLVSKEETFYLGIKLLAKIYNLEVIEEYYYFYNIILYLVANEKFIDECIREIHLYTRIHKELIFYKSTVHGTSIFVNFIKTSW